VDTPLSESRFSSYLQGWVDETREDDHHDDAAHLSHEDEHDEHDDDDEESHQHAEAILSDTEPYPEEKDSSNPDELAESEELIAEVNLNQSEQEQTETNDSNENADAPSQEDEEEEDDNNASLDNDNDDDDAPTSAQDDELPNLFEDSAPFEEEVSST